MSLFIPLWLVVAAVGFGLWKMGNKWIAVGVFAIAAVWAGFLNIPFLAPVVDQVKSWIA